MQASLPLWRPSIAPRAALASVMSLALLFAAMRAAGMLGLATLRWLLPLDFVLMALSPWALLSAEGRRQAGLVRAAPGAYFPALAAGALAALACYGAGFALFGHGAVNWYVTIAASYKGMFDTIGLSLWQLHLAFTVPALLFSPVGEEVFFRGVMQRALEERMAPAAATVVESPPSAWSTCVITGWCAAAPACHGCRCPRRFGCCSCSWRPCCSPRSGNAAARCTRPLRRTPRSTWR